MTRRTPVEDRTLIQALMQRGWYRERELPPDASGLARWRFRSGHCLEDPERGSMIVQAPNERLAMRAMLEALATQEGPNGEFVVVAG